MKKTKDDLYIKNLIDKGVKKINRGKQFEKDMKRGYSRLLDQLRICIKCEERMKSEMISNIEKIFPGYKNEYYPKQPEKNVEAWGWNQAIKSMRKRLENLKKGGDKNG